MSDSAGARYRALHDKFFVLPNPWDPGSAVMMEALGFVALATTSSGLAMSRAGQDGDIGRDELVEHVAELTSVVGVPINVDAERCYADDPSGVAETVALLAGAGAGGLSIEDWDAATGAVDPIDKATERVAAAVEEAARHQVVVTARCENHIRNVDDLDDTIARLVSYRDAGAEVLYAPGLRSRADIARVVDLGLPVNVLAMPGTPSPVELAGLGVIRMSTGGALARLAYTAMEDAARALLDGVR